MKTYRECLKNIIKTERDLYYGGALICIDAGTRSVVAWIFEKTSTDLDKDIKALKSAEVLK